MPLHHASHGPPPPLRGGGTSDTAALRFGSIAEPACCRQSSAPSSAGGLMADLTIYLGNKNYSSWSLRPWLVLKRVTVGFDEVVIPLYQPTSRETVQKYSPSGRVPALRHGEVTVWESLAICEYLAESFPTFDLW